MQQRTSILVLNFGGQYNQLIVRRIRDLGYYCELIPYDLDIEMIKSKKPQAIILSGGPNSIYELNAPKLNAKLFDLNIPILGICYGMQAIVNFFAGKVVASEKREYGQTDISLDCNSQLFLGIESKNIALMSHSDQIEKLPLNFDLIAHTKNTSYAAIENKKDHIYGVQFHPESQHTNFGIQMLKNFLEHICKLKPNWKMEDFIVQQVEQINKEVNNDNVICALSGGVDSAVAAAIVYKSIKNKLFCIFVDHGLMRQGEVEDVKIEFEKQFGKNLIVVNARVLFLNALKDVEDPETKRKIIGKLFIDIFVTEAKKIPNVKYLVQGTIYPDIIESGFDEKNVIKSHHNVGGLPKDLKFKLIEPLKELFKDEVRKIGKEIGLKDSLINRQPFPGPGLAVRIIGSITQDKILLLQQADAILREEIFNSNWNQKLFQYFAVLTNTKTIGVLGDARTFGYTIALRAVQSEDAMTATWAKIDYELLEIISKRITNEVKNVNRVVYDITSKPPATIEWE